jgi:hypothetical protein
MSIVGDEFPVDVFLSYRWSKIGDDSEPLFVKWTRHFKRTLHEELSYLYEIDAKVFFDKDDIDPHRELDSQLEKNARDAAVFVPLLSQHYRKSDYCKRELEWWRQAQAEQRLDEAGRLLVVRAWGDPPPSDRYWADVLTERNIKGFGVCFFSLKRNPPEIRPFGWAEKKEDEIKGKEFHEKIDELCDQISNAIKELRMQLEERKQENSTRPTRTNQNLKIYLHGLEEDAKQWRSLSETLRQHGMEVVPDRPATNARTVTVQERLDAEARMGTALRECDSMVMIAPDDDKQWQDECLLARRGTQLALAFRKQPNSSFPIAVVDSVTDPDRVTRREGEAKFLQFARFTPDSSDLAGKIESYIREKQG